jgi:hypothetical protein
MTASGSTVARRAGELPKVRQGGEAGFPISLALHEAIERLDALVAGAWMERVAADSKGGKPGGSLIVSPKYNLFLNNCNTM